MKINKFFRRFKNIYSFYHLSMFFAFSLFIFLLFFAINPKYSPILFPFKRTKMLSSFIEGTTLHGKINPEEFWTLREFYYPGTLKVDKYSYPEPFLFFNSKKIQSTESLVDTTNSKNMIFPEIRGKKLVYKSLSELIFYENPSELRIIFYKPISEMINVNAIYDYKDKDKKLLEGKSWYTDTIINIR